VNIIVCIKQVPGTTQVKINPDTGTLVRDGVEAVVNPFDEYAIEEALRIREKQGGTIKVVTMGPPQADDILRTAIAMGADEGYLVTDRAFAGSDTWATSYTLSAAIRKIGNFDMILCGKQAIDGDTGQVGPGIARQLGITQLTYIFKIQQIDFDAKTIRVERLLEEGREVVESHLPALITVVKDINQPRYPNFKGIRRANRMEIPVWTADMLPETKPELLGLDGSPPRVVTVFNPPARGGAIDMMPAGTPQEQAAALADRLLGEKII
jgi:electron transfer flavoprotein alpha/beta subunit